MNMYAFYVCRGHSLDALANLSYVENIFMHCAREEYYKEESEKLKKTLG